ncbi:MAG: M23 family metallopeptidase [Anaerolineaceae bacterium]|nr:M23 family metallopeptidase [Anaerolineaceae bacterium]
MKTSLKIVAGVIIVAGLVTAYYFYKRSGGGDTSPRSPKVDAWIRNPGGHPDWAVQALQRCGTAPFILPTSGFIGYLWADTFEANHSHQGIDIFGGTQPDQTPVYSAFDGYLSRLPDWKSSLIIRIPNDPLMPGRQIWTYYTHMADKQGNSFISINFPAGTSEVFVKAGTPLGHQGNYSGDPNQPVGVHLHFSIVKDNGAGKFLNELDINNTYDPSPYFQLNLNASKNQAEIPVCSPPNESTPAQ